MLKIDLDQNILGKEERLDGALLHAVEEEINRQVPDAPKGVIAAAFVTDDRMQELNKMYRGKDKVTDVLSFSYVDDEYAETLGDVVISPEQARRQAEEGLRHELVTLLVHGILHAFGYDHETEEDASVMFPLQDKIIDTIEI